MPNVERRSFDGRAAGVQDTVPDLVQSECEAGGGQRNDKSFLSSRHQPQAGPSRQYPTQLPCAPVSPARRHRYEREEDQEHFMDKVSAVENQRRRNGGKNCGPDYARSAKSIGEESQRQQQSQ